ncbi:cytochrome c oxidase subunit II [Solirhodobacter olei]|uniref:cytochrome c oxidase subunit II n=1 Tax=Solirhodobacter olei TaxID=2493082 RepID=UPI000FDCCCAD|nr:cytochrome c oxidase subunit II [Solirhodobacter olei]
MRTTTLTAGLAAGFGAALALFATAATSVAQTTLPAIGKPTDGAVGFQPAGTEVATRLQGLEHFITWIMAVIVLFVTALLLYTIVRYNRRANPKAASFTHNSPLEIAWTLIPIVILVVIGAYSLPVLFLEEEIPKQPDITIRATGNQWYWHYDYMAANTTKAKAEFGFDSYMIGSPASISAADDKAGVKPYILNDAMRAKLQKAGYTPDEFKLAVDNPVVVPVGKTVVVQVTGADVIHSWKVPAFGVMQDAVPGRLADVWFKADKEGIYFGQCSELCGKDHAFMPIEVKVVSEAEYQAWLGKAKQLFAEAAPEVSAPVQVASAD